MLETKYLLGFAMALADDWLILNMTESKNVWMATLGNVVSNLAIFIARG